MEKQQQWQHLLTPNTHNLQKTKKLNILSKHIKSALDKYEVHTSTCIELPGGLQVADTGLHLGKELTNILCFVFQSSKKKKEATKNKSDDDSDDDEKSEKSEKSEPRPKKTESEEDEEDSDASHDDGEVEKSTRSTRSKGDEKLEELDENPEAEEDDAESTGGEESPDNDSSGEE